MEPKKTAKAHLTVRSSNQSLLATLLQALNDPSTEMYCLIRPPDLEECTIFVTKDVSFDVTLINDAKMEGFSNVVVRVWMDVLVHTLSVGEMEFEMKWIPGGVEGERMWIRARDVRCKILGDEGVRKGVEEMVRDGVIREEDDEEGLQLRKRDKALIAAEVLKGEAERAGKGVADDIKLAAGGVVVGSLFRGIKKGVGAIIKSAVEEGVRGDEDLLGDTPVKNKEEVEVASEFGKLFDGLGVQKGENGNFAAGQQNQHQHQQQPHQHGETQREGIAVESKFGKLFDGIGEEVAGTSGRPNEKPEGKFAALFEERRVGEYEEGGGGSGGSGGGGGSVLGGFFGALGLENLSHAVAPPPPPMSQAQTGTEAGTTRSSPGQSEFTEEVFVETLQEPELIHQPLIVVPVSNVNLNVIPPLSGGSRKDVGVEMDFGVEMQKDYTKSELKRITLGYDKDGGLGGDFGKDNPPPGKKFVAYGKGFMSISWGSADE
ncbi:hypothetical protein TrST_g11057 [Triparma strigata]|uniref:Uncharacterized protein n=1 Tax=Triparma strigata TaxID=1606541 RepID=A0A9W7DWC0_9STRA|nr:hypothetical protein TrST_g11057 [Triparma strigata]